MAKPEKTKDKRLFAFTDFNEEHMKGNFWQDFYKNENVRYMLIGIEICPTTNKKHLQGFIYFKNERSFNAIQKKTKNVHLEQCRYDAISNCTYCAKDGNLFYEDGKKPAQGERNDLILIKDEIVRGETSLNDIILERPNIYHLYGRTLSAIENIANRKKWRTWMTKGIWYHGPTGCGKSREAFKNYHPDTHYALNLQDKGWWDGYSGQEIVIIDEFRGDLTFKYLLQLCDINPMTVPRRGNAPYPFLAKKVIITSSKHPINVYSHILDQEENFAQFERRFEIISLAAVLSVKPENTAEVLG